MPCIALLACMALVDSSLLTFSRSISLKTYGLDPAHHYTAPGLANDVLFKHTKMGLEKITDIDISQC